MAVVAFATASATWAEGGRPVTAGQAQAAPPTVVFSDAAEAWSSLERTTVAIVRAVHRGAERHPAAALAFLAGALVPVLALAAALARSAARHRRRRIEGSQDMPAVTGGRRSASAWVEVAGGRQRVPVGELLRIGSSEDCDVAVRADGASGKAAMHALIQRTPEREFIIFDVSSDPAPAIAVNGKPLRRGRLRDGDRIAVGAGQLVFRLDMPAAAAAPGSAP